jgi:hypothetical protein
LPPLPSHTHSSLGRFKKNVYGTKNTIVQLNKDLKCKYWSVYLYIGTTHNDYYQTSTAAQESGDGCKFYRWTDSRMTSQRTGLDSGGMQIYIILIFLDHIYF